MNEKVFLLGSLALRTATPVRNSRDLTGLVDDDHAMTRAPLRNAADVEVSFATPATVGKSGVMR